MFSSFFGSGSDTSSAPAARAASSPAAPPFTILVIQQNDFDWEEIFKSVLPDMTVKMTNKQQARPLQVVQTSWDDLVMGPCDNYSKDPRQRCTFSVRKRWVNGKPVPLPQRCMPSNSVDFVICRNEVFAPGADHRNKLLALMYSDVPCVNSLRSIFLGAERAIMQGSLNALAARTNPPMPLMPQQFFASHEGFFYAQSFPAVIKMGSAHAGAGKIMVQNHKVMEDVRSLMMMNSDKQHGAFGEPFIKGMCDLRLQKVGKTMRAFKRVSVSGDWKTQTGSCMFDEIEVLPRYAAWLEAAENLFGADAPMAILTIDILVEEGTEKEYVMEVNGTSSGLGGPEHQDEDNRDIARLVLEKVSKLA